MADNMTPEQRSRTMSRIRKTDTKPELIIRRLSFARGLRYRKYSAYLPGKPDMVFASARVVVFVDGDFWHGWEFDKWETKLSSLYWKEKIRRNRERDKEQCACLEADGWTVLRIWEHEVEADADACVDRIEVAVRGRLGRRRPKTERNRARRTDVEEHAGPSQRPIARPGKTEVTDAVDRLLRLLEVEPLAPSLVQAALRLKDRHTFKENYLRPALAEGLVEMTIPDKPSSRIQKYCLTTAGKTRLTKGHTS